MSVSEAGMAREFHIQQPLPVKAILYPSGGTYFAIHLPHYPTRWQRWWQLALLGFRYELADSKEN